MATELEIGRLAIAWHQADMEALELEERTTVATLGMSLLAADYAGIDPAQKKIDRQWKVAAKAAGDAWDAFQSALVGTEIEQGDLLA